MSMQIYTKYSLNNMQVFEKIIKDEIFLVFSVLLKLIYISLGKLF